MSPDQVFTTGSEEGDDRVTFTVKDSVEKAARDCATAKRIVKELEAKMEERVIGLMVPDWQETVTSDQYKIWLASQAPEVQQVAQTTTSAQELGRVLTAYKQHANKATVAQKNQKRLEAALVPDGVPQQRPPEPSENDAFKDGWNNVRRHGM